ncbi:MAG: hypothetical protein M3Y20_03745 [Actinomycetota bacterium]|nr:hypothetical protein [Actinomycetota bacterium]
MPTSSDGIFEATFDPAWAAVNLIVDGGMWPSAVASITIARQVAGVPDVPVRGVDSLAVVGGYFVGSDSEAPLESPVTYQLTGYAANGTVVKVVVVAVDTTGAADGLWVKVPGRPSLTVCTRFRELGDIQSATIGGTYQILGAGTVAQTTAQWGGISADRTRVGLTTGRGAHTARLDEALRTARVVLLQPVGTTDLPPGWYYVSTVTRSNPGGFEEFAERWWSLDVERTETPAGDGRGIPGVSWQSVLDTYPTWTSVLADVDTWFDLQLGA